MITVKIKNNSKQAKLFLEYIKSLSFVEFVNSNSKKIIYPSKHDIVSECRKSRKKIAAIYNETK